MTMFSVTHNSLCCECLLSAKQFRPQVPSSWGQCTRTWMHTETKYHVVAVLPLYAKNTSECICTLYEQNQLQTGPRTFHKLYNCLWKYQVQEIYAQVKYEFYVCQLRYFLKDVFKYRSTFACGMLPVSLEVFRSNANYPLRCKFSL